MPSASSMGHEQHPRDGCDRGESTSRHPLADVHRGAPSREIPGLGASVRPPMSADVHSTFSERRCRQTCRDVRWSGCGTCLHCPVRQLRPPNTVRSGCCHVWRRSSPTALKSCSPDTSGVRWEHEQDISSAMSRGVAGGDRAGVAAASAEPLRPADPNRHRPRLYAAP
jgi:hypothetical protein